MVKMTYFVTSDIHGNKEITLDLLSLAQQRSVDGMIITGDLCPRDMEVSLALQNAPFPVHVVRGNCDSPWDYKDLGLPIPQISDMVVRDDGTRIVFSHGHLIWEPKDLCGDIKAGDIVITGHTHVAELYRDENGVIILNPGSPARPRSQQGATYAIIYPDRIAVMRYPSGKIISSLEIRE